jgi:TusA-related sulfurtransferase
MADIKSAREIAQEKLNSVGETTEEERLRWEYFPRGEKLAVSYLDKKFKFNAELVKYEAKVKRYVIAGAEKVLIANIDLPKNEMVREKNERTMNALLEIKSDKQKAKEVIDKIQQLFNHYGEQGKQQQEQAYESLKTEYSSRMQQAVEQQLGSVVSGLDMNVEKLPQFKEEWQRTLTKMDKQYLQFLIEYKQELKNID